MQNQAKTLLKLSCYIRKSSLFNNSYLYFLPIFGINAPYRFFFPSSLTDRSFSILRRWGRTNIIIPILQMKPRRHSEAEWLAQSHHVCDQSGNTVPNLLPISFSQNHQQYLQKVSYIIYCLLQLKPRVQGREKEERQLFLVTLFPFRGQSVFPKMLILLKTQCWETKLWPWQS